MLLLIFTEEEWDVRILSQCESKKYLPDPEIQNLKNIYHFPFSVTKQLRKHTVPASGGGRVEERHKKQSLK